jgi:hypothetical protein
MISVIPGSAIFSYTTRSDEAALRRASKICPINEAESFNVPL